MGEYAVYRAGRDVNGDIVQLCGPWGKASAVSVMQMIQLGHRYFVPLDDGSKSWISIVRGARRPYLRTNWDGTTENNLDELPPC